VEIKPKGGLPGPDDPITPSFRRYKSDDSTDTLEVKLPGCIFPIVKNEGKPSHVHTWLPKHPIAAGIPPPSTFPKRRSMAGLSMCQTRRDDI